MTEVETDFFTKDFLRSMKRAIYIGVAVRAATAVAVIAFAGLILKWVFG